MWQTDQAKIALAATQIAQKLEERRPPADLDPRQLRNWKPVRRKWFLLVDDLTLLSPNGPSSTLLQPLLPAVESARNLDFHVIASASIDNWYARGGANKLIQAMQRGGTSALILDGDKSNVIIDAVRPAARIPGRGELYLRKEGGQLIQVALPPAVD